jgi:hypothetical protein
MHYNALSAFRAYTQYFANFVRVGRSYYRASLNWHLPQRIARSRSHVFAAQNARHT